MKRKNMILVLAILMLLPSLILADVYMKQKQHNSGFEMMGQKQEAETVIQEVWMAKDKVAMISPQKTILIRMDKNVQYVIDHMEKTVMEMPMGGSKEKASEGSMADIQKMMGAMMKDVKVTVRATSETKKIGKWSCKKYIQEMTMFTGPIQTEIWATEDLKMDTDLAASMSMSGAALIPGMSAHLEKLQQESKKIKGVPVRTITNSEMMGQSMTPSMELLEYKITKAPTHVFEVPAGYKKKTMAMPGF